MPIKSLVINAGTSMTAPFASSDLKLSQNKLKLNKNAFTVVTVTLQVENVPTLLDNHYTYYKKLVLDIFYYIEFLL